MNKLLSLVTFIFPGIPFFLMGRILEGAAATVMQASVIGWIPAMIWAKKAWAKEHPKAIVAEKATPTQPDIKPTPAPNVEMPLESPEQQNTHKTIQHENL